MNIRRYRRAVLGSWMAICLAFLALPAQADITAEVEHVLAQASPGHSPVEDLAELGPEAVPILLALVNAGDAAAPWAAAALDRIGDRHPQPHPCRAVAPATPVDDQYLLAVALDKSLTHAARVSAIRLLGRIGATDVVDRMHPLLFELGLNAEVVAAWGRMGSRKAAQKLLYDANLLEHRDWALCAVLACPDNEGYAIVFESLRDRAVTPGSGTALPRQHLQCLHARVGAEADEVLLAALDHADADCRQVVVEALLARGGQRPELLKQAYDQAPSAGLALRFWRALDGAPALAPRLATMEIDIGTAPDDEVVLGEGWGPAARDATGTFRWGIAYSTSLELPRIADRELTIELDVETPTGETVHLSPALGRHRFPAHDIRGPGTVRLEVSAAQVKGATEFTLGLRQRRLWRPDPPEEPYHRGVALRAVRLK